MSYHNTGVYIMTDNRYAPFIAYTKKRRIHLQRHDVTKISRVSCQKGPTRHAYAWQIGPFWQDTLDM